MAMSAPQTKDSLAYYLTGGAVNARPMGWKLCLHTANPGVAGTVSEVTDSAYARQNILFAVDNTDVTLPFASNTALVAFPAAATAYTVTHIVVRDQAANVLVVQALVDAKPIAIGAQASMAAGELVIGRT